MTERLSNSAMSEKSAQRQAHYGAWYFSGTRCLCPPAYDRFTSPNSICTKRDSVGKSLVLLVEDLQLVGSDKFI